MHYVIGFTFRAGDTSTIKRGGSVLQQMNQAKLDSKGAINTLFETGKDYMLYYIKPLIENNTKKFIYVFINKETKKVFEMNFENTFEADSYIARVSGKTEELKIQRVKSQEALEKLG